MMSKNTFSWGSAPITSLCRFIGVDLVTSDCDNNSDKGISSRRWFSKYFSYLALTTNSILAFTVLVMSLRDLDMALFIYSPTEYGKNGSKVARWNMALDFINFSTNIITSHCSLCFVVRKHWGSFMKCLKLAEKFVDASYLTCVRRNSLIGLTYVIAFVSMKFIPASYSGI